MSSEFELSLKRFAAFLREALEPAVYPVSAPLRVGAYLIADPRAALPTPEAALGAEFAPVEMGWRWGPRWSTAWFRARGEMPAAMAGRPVVVRFSSGTEAMAWRRGRAGFEPWQGLDVNRDALPLTENAAAGAPIDVLIEAACNHPFGVTGFEWDDAEVHHRWGSDAPGRLERCEVAVIDRGVRDLAWSYAFALGLAAELPRESSRAKDLFGALQRATNAVDPRRVGETASAASALLAAGLGRPASGSATRCVAVGHAHIDTAWLWPIRETRRKCLRSFSNVLGLMDRNPDLGFLCSQAQQYAWVEEDSPALFARIAARVEEGRWEPGGGMWVEPDANVPSGESLVRQILHADRWWRARFGERGRQRHLFLPDTFGFPASLPQIMAGAGLDTFITNKMSWNATNAFPHTTFRWRGIDGTEVLAHLTPGADYNAVNTPKELRRGEAGHRDAHRPGADGGTARWLQPFGYGDGGGGPTERSVRYAELASDCEGLARVSLGSASGFCDALHADAAASAARGESVPSWWGELYLELHRGTLTTQAWIKRANRRAEGRLRLAEVLTFAGPRGAADGGGAAARLDGAWKRVLLNQFHDILPGSSIGAVYEDARRDYEAVAAAADDLIGAGMAAWAEGLDTTGMERPVAVFNPASHPRFGVVELSDRLGFAPLVPGLGVKVIDAAAPPTCAAVEVGGGVLSNGLVRAEIDPLGRVVALGLAGSEMDLCRRADGRSVPMNQLVLYEDRPAMWDAWDVDWHYEQTPVPVDGPPDSWRVVPTGPLRGEIEVSRPLGAASRITQRFILDAQGSRLDVRTTVDWREDRRLLRVLFPTDILATEATYDIQFGHLTRPTHRNTPWDAARFEVCAHRWMDLSERGRGLALLNDCKYGHSCHEGVLGLSLLRSPKRPDPAADMGMHEFAYSLVPHGGDWRAAGVELLAEEMNSPLMVLELPPGRAGPLGKSWSPFDVQPEGDFRVAVSCLKRAEDDDRIIVRLHESHAGRGRVAIRWNLPVAGVEPVDLLERPAALAGFAHSGAGVGATSLFDVRPFQIVTLAVRLAR